MHNIANIIKVKMRIYILILIIFIGLIITYTNLSITFGFSLSSKNQNAFSAFEYLSKLPEGLILISSKNQIIFTRDETLKITEWLDKEGKSKSEINIFDKNKMTINLNYLNDFDLTKYLNKLFIIPYTEIKNIKISNKESQIKIDFLFNQHRAK